MQLNNVFPKGRCIDGHIDRVSRHGPTATTGMMLVSHEV
jgi:hypothetical protein